MVGQPKGRRHEAGPKTKDSAETLPPEVKRITQHNSLRREGETENGKKKKANEDDPYILGTDCDETRNSGRNYIPERSCVYMFIGRIWLSFVFPFPLHLLLSPSPRFLLLLVLPQSSADAREVLVFSPTSSSNENSD